MKKFLSTITAVSIMAASATGISASASGMFAPIRAFFDSVVTVMDDLSSTPTETPTLKPTERPTERPTEAPTERPTERPTEAPTERPTERPTEAPTERPTEAPTERPTERPTEAPTERPTEAPQTITDIKLNKQTLTLKKGDTFNFVATVEPAGAIPETYIWNTTNDCVKVSDGVVTAVKEGDTVVSVVTSNSRLVASCYVSVEEDNGVIALSVSEGVKEVVVTREGLSTEITAGENIIESGTYTVTAKSENNYTLNDYSGTVTIAKNVVTPLTVTATRTHYSITLPTVSGVTVTPVNGSSEAVQPGGSYSFSVSLGASYDASNLAVKANGTVLTPVNGIYTVSNINDDVVITIDGVESKSWDASIKSVTVKDKEAVLGASNVYSVTLPYGETVKTSDIKVVVNDEKSSFTITTVDGVYTITVKAEDGTTNVYTLSIKNAAATNIDNFKLAIQSLYFNDVSQRASGSYESQDEVRADITDDIKRIADQYQGISYKVENGTSKQPKQGTLSSPTSEDGYYNFTVTLTSGDDTRTISITIDIIGYDYLVASSNITATATTVTIKNVSNDAEVALYTRQGGRLRNWTSPTRNNTVTFSNLSGGESYGVKIRAIGSSDIPSGSTYVTTLEGSHQGASSYHTVYFDEGDHGTIVSGKAKQTVGNTRVADYPTIKADEGYIFKGWSSNGVLIENPKTYYIRSNTSFIAMYERASGSSYSTSVKSTIAETPTTYNRPTTSPASYVFSDVASGSWYHDSVMNVCNKGFMNGVTNTSFEPDSKLTRAMLVTVLYRYASEPKVYQNVSFSDVSSDTWYSNAVAWAAEAGIVEGNDEGLFEPNSYITREQFAAIIFRYSEAFGYDTTASGNIIKYSDSHAISDWAQRALIWTTGANIINGKDNNILDPKGNATRAEAAAIIERFDKIIGD